jgi:hypothetical protein
VYGVTLLLVPLLFGAHQLTRFLFCVMRISSRTVFCTYVVVERLVFSRTVFCTYGVSVEHLFCIWCISSCALSSARGVIERLFCVVLGSGLPRGAC